MTAYLPRRTRGCIELDQEKDHNPSLHASRYSHDASLTGHRAIRRAQPIWAIAYIFDFYQCGPVAKGINSEHSGKAGAERNREVGAMKFLIRYGVAAILVLSLAASVSAGPLDDAIAAKKKGDYATALRLIRPLAEQGSASAQNELGLMYDQGEGLPNDDAEAVKWYRRAADRGYAFAQYNLGLKYHYGKGVAQNDAEALKWFLRATEQGFALAQYRVALAYGVGVGVPKDLAEAAKWYQRAADQGFAEAQTELALMYAHGAGIPQDRVRAYMWLTLAAAKGETTPVRDNIATEMTSAQIAEAEKLAREWQPGALVAGPLVDQRAAAKAFEDQYHKLSDAQKTEIDKNLESIAKRMSLAERKTLETELNTFLEKIQFLDERVALALDWHGLLHRTADGGLTWTEERLPLGSGFFGWLSKRRNMPAPDIVPFHNMHFADGLFGLIVGGLDVILQSEDGGLKWRALSSPSQSQLNAAYCNPRHTCWVAGGEHAVFRRDPGQSTWSRQKAPVEKPIVAIEFVDNSIGWAITEREIVGTKDGGEHWNLLFHDSEKHLRGLHFVDDHLGWIAGSDALIIHTDDGGRTWVEQEIPMPSKVQKKDVRLHAIRFADAQRGWAAGLHGIIFATRDGGESWEVQRCEGAPHNMFTIDSLAITDGPTVWAAGNSGNIYVSIDGGAFWFPVHGNALQMEDLIGRAMKALK
jgi:photosystem II stability/assembly factor-like uncharacterized protein